MRFAPRPLAPARARRFGAWAVALLAAAAPGCAGHRAVDEGPRTPPVVASPAVSTAVQVASSPELPRGGRSLFPQYRLVGFCGTPGAPALGRLDGNLTAKAKALQALADGYAADRKPLPVFELIAVVVQGAPGADGKYRRRLDDGTVDRYLKEARQARALLLLNIQPGQSDFLTEVSHFDRYLREPDVGVALDPEWAMKPRQLPGKFYGQTTGDTINEVAAHLSAIITEGRLPEKALVFHQVNGFVVKDESVLKAYPGVVVIKSVDGLGPKHAKIETYDYLMRSLVPGVHAGFKLFFDEDRRIGGQLMSAAEVMSLAPKPEYVMYE